MGIIKWVFYKALKGADMAAAIALFVLAVLALSMAMTLLDGAGRLLWMIVLA
jgi:hypothetical protein